MTPRPKSRPAFTLIELLVVLAVIGILIALLMPAVQSARMAARRVQCESKLHQLGIALHNYHDTHLVFPSGSYVLGPSFPTQSGWGWGAMLLPYLEQASLQRGIDFQIGTAVGPNRDVIRQHVPFWFCPADVSPPSISVQLPGEGDITVAAGNYCGVEPMLAEMSRVRIREITDGLSNTLFVGERVYQPSEAGSLEFTSSWIGQVATETVTVSQSIPHLEATPVNPINVALDFPQAFTSRHPGGAQFLFCDGSVRLLSETIDLSVYQGLGTPNGGEVVSF